MYFYAMIFFSRLKEGLARTRTQIASIVGIATCFDDAFYGTLEEALVAADIGLDRSLEIIGRLKQEIKSKGIGTPQEAYRVLKELLVADCTLPETAPDVAPVTAVKPRVILVIRQGINLIDRQQHHRFYFHQRRRHHKKLPCHLDIEHLYHFNIADILFCNF